MRDAQKPDHVSLNTLVNRLREGRFVIPDFQREFEWKPWDISDLLRSIFSDYYIGSLLLWKAKPENVEALSCEGIYGYNGDGKPEHIVLDGQQRLTAMYYAFFAPDKELPTRANRYYYFMRVDRFMADEVDKAFDYDWSRRWKKLIADSNAQYEQHIFPLAVVGQEGWALSTWAQGYAQHWKDKMSAAEAQSDQEAVSVAELNAENAKKFGEHLRGIVEQYQISFIELDQQLEIEKVCDIFTKLNSTGIQLDTFDLINALLKPKGLQLKQMWREAAKELEFVETDRMNTYILQVMSILRQGYCSPKYLYFLLPGIEKPIRDPDGTRRKEILITDTTDFKSRWDSAVGALSNAVNLLRHPQEFGVVSSNYLPYVSILPAFAAIQWHVKSLPANRQLEAQRKVRHWYWASVFLSRYSGSVESTASRDFLDMKEWLADDKAEPLLIKEFEERFRSIDLRKETKRGTSVYNGIFNLFVIQGASDWMTGNKPQHGDLDDHHIIPSAKSAELNLDNPNLIHSVLNRAPLTAETNRKVIRDRWPNEYLPSLIEQNGEARVRAVLESHFISSVALEILLRKPFGKADYEAFLSERNRTILGAIENLLIKERLDLSPQLRELDGRLEEVEIGIRDLISSSLGGDASQLPGHVGQKIAERIQAAIRKNPGLERETFETIERKLEYADFRELQDIITNGSLWPRFEPKFLNKDGLIRKFDQLAELRNGIRHSRTVHEVAQREGEAALLWFEQILPRKAT
jgi:hypothetical protein